MLIYQHLIVTIYKSLYMYMMLALTSSINIVLICYIFRLLHITVYGVCVNHGKFVAMKMYVAATKKITIYGSLCKYSIFNL